MRLTRAVLLLIVVVTGAAYCRAAPPMRDPPSMNVLTPAQWRKVDEGVDRGLAWLAAQQQPDGSMPTYDTGQPAVTSLAIMAFLSRGHVPGEGPYGTVLDRAIDFVISQQREDGLLYGGLTDMPAHAYYQGSHTATYNHAISGLMLGEVYGMTDGRRSEKVRTAIVNALDFARQLQRRPSKYAVDNYGWRYLKHLDIENKSEADLSVTGWFVMFYRSAKNAEFEVPQEFVEDAVSFVRGCYDEDSGTFLYGPYGRDRRTSRAMNGAGLLCLTITGNYDEKMAAKAGSYILERPFTEYNKNVGAERFHYGAYYCSQAMFMLGGEHWRSFYPKLAGTLLTNQSRAGYWQNEVSHKDSLFGSTYSTSLAILSLTPPYQLLPIYQR